MRRQLTKKEIKITDDILLWRDPKGKEKGNGKEIIFLPNTPKSVLEGYEYLKNNPNSCRNTAE